MKNSRRSFFQTLAGAGFAALAFPAETQKSNMIVRSARPQDLEMPLSGFSSWLTPIDSFFVRSHHYTPEVKLEEWKLQIGGEVERPVRLTMTELKKLPR